MTTTTRVPAALLLIALALAGCAEEPPEAAAAPTPKVAESPAAEAPEPAEPAGLEDPEPDDMTSEFPEYADLPERGGRYYAVLLSADGRAAVDASVRAVARYGYDAGVGDLGCLGGAPEAYGVPGSTLASYLLFEDERSAFRFTDAYALAEDGTQSGVALVRANCLD